MYYLKQLSEYLIQNNLATIGNINIGRFDIDKKNSLMLMNNIPVGNHHLTFSKPSKYFKSSIKIIFNGNENYVESSNKINEIFIHFVNNPNIEEIKLKQIMVEEPVFIEKVKNIYKFIVILNVIYIQ